MAFKNPLSLSNIPIETIAPGEFGPGEWYLNEDAHILTSRPSASGYLILEQGELRLVDDPFGTPSLTVSLDDPDGGYIQTDTWHPMTLSGTWVPVGFAVQVPEYRALPDGSIVCRGTIKNNSAVNNGVIVGSMPAGYRPSAEQDFTVLTTNSGTGTNAGKLVFYANGDIKLWDWTTVARTVPQVTLSAVRFWRT